MAEEKAQKETKEKAQEETKEEMSKLTRTAYEVIQGGWSQGSTRQKYLIDAGFNPYEVEEEVKRLRDEKNKEKK